MTDQRHFHNFAPADAVQYDGTWASLSATDDWFPEDVSRGASRDNGNEAMSLDWYFPSGQRIGVEFVPGQWIVRQGSRVWAQDEEPARVVRWGWANSRYGDGGMNQDTEESVRYFHNLDPEKFGLHRRPVLSNGWTGPWSPVEGGAE